MWDPASRLSDHVNHFTSRDRLKSDALENGSQRKLRRGNESLAKLIPIRDSPHPPSIASPQLTQQQVHD